jgi:Zn-finger nucleic acid-binding protein
MDKSIMCPKCKVITNRIALEPELFIDRCPDCTGVWLDQGELSRISDVPEGVFRWEQAVSSGRKTEFSCPSCMNKENQLEEVKYSSDGVRIKIDLCSHCRGIWLDKNELPLFLGMIQRLRLLHKKLT